VTRVLFALCLSLLTATLGLAETTEAPPAFELADVHPSEHSTSRDAQEVSGGLMRGGIYRLRHATMLDLVRIAYAVHAKKVLGGPSWLEMDRFDIRAKAPAGATPETVKPMLRALLAERFSLVAHRDTRPVPAWSLTAGTRPPLKQSDDSGESGCHSGGSDDFIEVTCRNATMAAFVSNLGRIDGAWYYIADNLVADRTGLEGAWDFDFRYSRRWTATAPGSQIVSLFDALEKIGLKLEPSMIPMPVVVLDSVNRTPTPNSPAVDKTFPPPPPAEFEVADVKPTAPDSRGDR
jgi:uncharacterized protein (TIGR03435 family)